MAEIIQYSHQLEKKSRWKPNAIVHTKPFSGGCTTTPIVGFKWKYYGAAFRLDAGDGKYVDNLHDTKGHVVYVDVKSGVVTTDADEVLIRG